MENKCPPTTGICCVLKSRYPQDVEFSRKATIVAAEGGKTYILYNPSGKCIAETRVDNGILASSSSRRADLLIVDCDGAAGYLIEFKGTHVDNACTQLLETIHLLPFLFDQLKSLNARIICSRVPAPNLRSSKQKLLEKKCKSKGGNLLIKSIRLEETV